MKTKRLLSILLTLCMLLSIVPAMGITAAADGSIVAQPSADNDYTFELDNPKNYTYTWYKAPTKVYLSEDDVCLFTGNASGETFSSVGGYLSLDNTYGTLYFETEATLTCYSVNLATDNGVQYINRSYFNLKDADGKDFTTKIYYYEKEKTYLNAEDENNLYTINKGSVSGNLFSAQFEDGTGAELNITLTDYATEKYYIIQNSNGGSTTTYYYNKNNTDTTGANEITGKNVVLTTSNNFLCVNIFYYPNYGIENKLSTNQKLDGEYYCEAVNNDDSTIVYKSNSVAIQTYSVANGTTGTNGIITLGAGYDCDAEYVPAGKTVTVSVNPDAGYALDTLKYNDGSDHTITANDDGYYTFTMPAADVTVSATFKQAADPVCYIDANDNSTFDGDDVKYASITAALAATKPSGKTADKPTVIRMIADSNENITVASDRFITLDLDGNVLKGDGKASVITNNGTLTVKDSNTGNKTHKFAPTDNLWVLDETNGSETVTGGCITGGAASHGGGIYTPGTLNFESGTVVGCSATYGGGIFCGDTGSGKVGTLNMSGTAAVIGCKSNGDIGGGIAVNGTFNMTGGSVTNCTGGKGGGVFINTYGAFTMTGGAITKNNATTRNGGVEVKGSIILGGTAKITDNTLNGTTASNLTLNGGSASISTETPLADGADIRVGDGFTVSNAKAADMSYFTSDTAEKALKYNEETGKLETVVAYTVTADQSCVNGTVSVGTKTSYGEGDTVTVTATPAEGYELDTISVYKTGDTSTTVTVTDGKFTMPAYAVTVSATFKLVATNVSLNTNKTTLKVGGTTQLTATVEPDGVTDKSVTWSSSDESVVKVDENGNLTAIGVGCANVVAVSNSNSSLKATCKVIVYKEQTKDDCITFSSTVSFTLKPYNGSKNWDGTLYYSTDKSAWTAWTGSLITAVKTGDNYYLYLRGDINNTRISTGDSYGRWDLTLTSKTASISCTGNIETLRGATGDAASPQPMASGCYAYLFCYNYSTNTNNRLISAPSLPATQLAASCYSRMFYGCQALAAAPELPAATLASYCYNNMFNSCKALTVPASMAHVTTVGICCCMNMYSGCTNLKVYSSSVEGYSKAWKATSALTEAAGWSTYMFSNTGGSFTSAPTIGATYYVEDNFEFAVNTVGVPDGKSAAVSFTVGGETVETAKPGTTVTVVADEIEGYTAFFSSDDTKIDEYGSFTMPAKDVTVTVTYRENEDFITFTSEKSFKIYSDKRWNGVLYYSTDKTTWNVWNGGWITAAQNGGTGAFNLYLKGTSANTYITGDAYSWKIECSADVACTGNIETLRGATGNKPSSTPMAANCYNSMFGSWDKLTTAPNLPATTLAESCYRNMFAECSSLTKAPALPATTLADNCYSHMFYNCTALTSAPVLKPTTVAIGCLSGMFSGCSHLYVESLGSADSATWIIPKTNINIFASVSMTSGTSLGSASVSYSPTTETYYKVTQAYDVTVSSNLSNGTVNFKVNTYANKDGSTTIAPDIVVTATAKNVSGYTAVLSSDDVTIAQNGTFTMPAKPITVTVTYTPIPVTGVTLNKEATSLGIDASETLVATVAPSTALTKTVQWSTDNATVATVDQNGKVTAHAKGTATITVTTTDGSYTDTCVVTVTKEKVDLPTAKTGLVYNGEMQTGVEIPEQAPYTVVTNTATDAGDYTAVLTLTDTAKYEWNLETPTSDAQSINWSIARKTINVTAENKTTYVGNNLAALTYTHDDLCGTDEFTGALETNADKDTASNQYIITQGTLALSSNYTIAFTPAVYTVSEMPTPVVEKPEGVEVSETSTDALQGFINSLKSDLESNAEFTFSVKKQEPEAAVKQAMQNTAGDKAELSFVDVSLTKTVGAEETEIESTGSVLLSFTYSYDMENRCNLQVYHYENGSTAKLSKVASADNAIHNTYVLEGSGKDTKITVYVSSFSPIAFASTEVPNSIQNATYNASLTLDADIDLNFTMGSLGTDGKGTDFVQSKLKITVDGTEMTGYKYENGELNVTLKSVAPQNIGKDLHIVITYDGIVIKDFYYSVKAYCDAVFKANTDGQYDKLATLCEALLNYGKYVADYVNSDTASTLNENHVKDFSSYTISGVNAGVINGTAGEANLSLGSTITLKYYVKTEETLTNTDSKTQNFFVLNGNGEQIDPERVSVKEYTTDDTYDYVVSIDLYASQLATQYTLKLKGVSTDDFCIPYGVYNYCSDAQKLTVEDGFTDTVKTLCKAIHNYSEAVQAYIASTAK